jgi:hypothetical protein
MVRSGRTYEGTYEEWEEYLDRAAARSRQAPFLKDEEDAGEREEIDRQDLERI